MNAGNGTGMTGAEVAFRTGGWLEPQYGAGGLVGPWHAESGAR
ncbi:hypothetical protein LJR030_002495 [Rhizobium sp. LjRoot30]